tara:strand:+ start:33250 stop:33399 length:150 start_codon:yes stop_codon:yes gene_type:complete
MWWIALVVFKTHEGTASSKGGRLWFPGHQGMVVEGLLKAQVGNLIPGAW